MIHFSNDSLFQWFTFPMVHFSNDSLFFQWFTFFPMIHFSNDSLFQWFTFPMIHFFSNDSLFLQWFTLQWFTLQWFTFPMIHFSNDSLFFQWFTFFPMIHFSNDSIFPMVHFSNMSNNMSNNAGHAKCQRPDPKQRESLLGVSRGQWEHSVVVQQWVVLIVHILLPILFSHLKLS